jgi:peptidoglycan hydrolase CwlO-like protein
MQKPTFNQAAISILILLMFIAICMLVNISGKIGKTQPVLHGISSEDKSIDSVVSRSSDIKSMNDEVQNISTKMDDILNELKVIEKSLTDEGMIKTEENINVIKKDVDDIKRTYDGING